jgi:hypothetical protein
LRARPILPAAFAAGAPHAEDAAPAAIFGTDRGFVLGASE